MEMGRFSIGIRDNFRFCKCFLIKGFTGRRFENSSKFSMHLGSVFRSQE